MFYIYQLLLTVDLPWFHFNKHAQLFCCALFPVVGPYGDGSPTTDLLFKVFERRGTET